ncbi:nonsense-mediated mRNA decay factor SMG8 isoform X4 [Plutella xylostella]|nr:nonsense-mediated mRNA decay factor SMG8 isoform X4 [Plutella xylostella]
MKEFSIKDVPDFSRKDRIVVVGVIGKSEYDYPNKTTPLLPSVDCDEIGIKCYWDERSNILYLHAITYLDAKQLTELACNLEEASKVSEKDADDAHWLVASGDLASESCKIFALIFHLCHIVVLSSPSPVFDLGYLQLFKAIDAYRNELLPQTTEALASSGAGGTWDSHGRTCCPRLLFHFHRAPRQLRRNPAALKRLEHSVEDQLYFILRKARIITNVCAKSLFAIPKNEEFVYINADDAAGRARDVGSLLKGLIHLCSGVPQEPPCDRPSFKQFVGGHVELARAGGFDDNVGKYAMTTSFFELPSAHSWQLAARALAPVYLSPPRAPRAPRDDEPGGALYDALATDVRFSQARCAKVLPIAQASYMEGLPSHYSSQHHAHKLSIAMSVLETMGRGPRAGGARAALRASCEAAWRARRLCEAASLTDHPCHHPQHDSSREHSSGVRYVHACDCGRSKASRDDPYCVRRANLGFYEDAAELCSACPTLTRREFPVFQPITATYREASVGGAPAEEARDEDSQPEPEGAWSHEPTALSPGSQGEDDSEGSPKAPSSPRRFDDVPDTHELTTVPDKSLVRQPSTTEYLPGMLHAASPPGLLPAHASWALVCLGPSSLYSHSLGLPEHLHPGFLPHTNYLLPWDCSVSRIEAVRAWRAAQAAARGRGSKPPAPHQLTVKIFIGYEYECPRGHRFMMSSPDTVTSGGGGGWRGGGPGEMPVYCPCPCRGAKPMLAQAMRIHVVTPKAPLHVTLDPKVQPVANGPVFIPQPVGSPTIKLSASLYWVLRLPYIYCDERGPLPRPKVVTTSGSIKDHMFGLAD